MPTARSIMTPPGREEQRQGLKRSSSAKKPLKLVLIGNGGCGKTSLAVAQAGAVYSQHYTPTIFDNYSVDVQIGGRTVGRAFTLGLSRASRCKGEDDVFQRKVLVADTAGEADFGQLRPLSYLDADVVLLCYAVDRPESFASLRTKWLPEVRQLCPPSVPLLIVGCKSDTRDEAITTTTTGSASRTAAVVVRNRATRLGGDAHHHHRGRRAGRGGALASRSSPQPQRQEVIAEAEDEESASSSSATSASPSQSAFVSLEEARQLAADECASGVVECSARTKENVRLVFESAVRAALGRRSRGGSCRVLGQLMRLRLVF